MLVLGVQFCFGSPVLMLSSRLPLPLYQRPGCEAIILKNVEGTKRIYSTTKQTRAVPLFAVVGALDETVPVNGGNGVNSGGQQPFQAAADSVKEISRLAPFACANAGKPIVRTKFVQNGVTHERLHLAGDCRPKGLQRATVPASELVVSIVVSDAGHTWPGQSQPGQQAVSKSYDATAEIAKFFLTHRKA